MLLLLYETSLEGKSITKQRETDSDLFEEFDPEDPSLYEDNEEDEQLSEVSKQRSRWISKMIIIGIALALVGNILAFWPQVYNLSSIQFLIKNNILSSDAHIQQYKKSVVVIKSGDSKGTGFNISPSGVIVTNEHVISNARSHSVSFSNGKTFNAKVIASDAAIDTAVLQVVSSDPLDLPALPLAADAQMESKLGAHIYVIGNPLFFRFIANEGAVTGYTGLQDWTQPVMMIDAPIYKGNSGSPVINEEGQVIGVVFATSKIKINGKSNNVGLAVPIEYVMPYIP